PPPPPNPPPPADAPGLAPSTRANAPSRRGALLTKNPGCCMALPYPQPRGLSPPNGRAARGDTTDRPRQAIEKRGEAPKRISCPSSKPSLRNGFEMSSRRGPSGDSQMMLAPAAARTAVESDKQIP